MTETQYPVLVYGTLRTSQPNWRYLLEGNIVHAETVNLTGYVLRDNSGAFPFAERGTVTDSIVAELMYIAPKQYTRTLKSLDFLEGFNGDGDLNNFYDRSLVNFEVNGTQRVAYLYVVSDSYLHAISDLPIIANGDWVEHKCQTV